MITEYELNSEGWIKPTGIIASKWNNDFGIEVYYEKGEYALHRSDTLNKVLICRGSNILICATVNDIYDLNNALDVYQRGNPNREAGTRTL